MSTEPTRPSDAERKVLRACPFTLMVYRRGKSSKAVVNEMRLVHKLQGEGYVHGTVEWSDHVQIIMRVALTDKGRIAIGWTPISGAALS